MTINGRGRFLPAAAVLLTICWLGGFDKSGYAQTATGQKSSPAQGALTGLVVRGPLTPLVRPGQPAAAPAAGVKILVYDAADQEIRTAVTDAQGRYRLSLPPGVYRVEIGPLPSRQFTKDLPAQVTISPGRETRLDVHVDTGMR